MYVTHVRFAVECSSTGDLQSRDAIHQVLDIGGPRLSGYGTRQFLAQVRLPFGPEIDSIQGQTGIIVTQVELRREQFQILPRKIVKLYLLRHVER